jgi:endonuclease/exonuclease/phosphatase family metal-dependent hydrolase
VKHKKGEGNMKLKIMTYNVQHFQNYITNVIDYDAVAKVVKKYDPDVIAFNEVRGEGPSKDYEEQTDIMQEKLGYPYKYFGEAIRFKDNPYGNAILSKYPIEVEKIMIPDPEFKLIKKGYYETRCIIKAKVLAPTEFTVMASHFGLNADEHMNAVTTMIKNMPEEKCVVMGDFNMQPHHPIIAGLLQRLNDTVEKIEGSILSIPSDTPSIKIDYILTSKDIACDYAEIPAETASDHRPYFAILEI